MIVSSKMSISRTDLQGLSQRYNLDVMQHEITIFTNYIAGEVVEKAKKGFKGVRFPLLKAGLPIEHNHRGLLNKHDPGPIPRDYLPYIIDKLNLTFDDVDIVCLETHLLVAWN